jgi:hypothetical protein
MILIKNDRRAVLKITTTPPVITIVLTVGIIVAIHTRYYNNIIFINIPLTAATTRLPDLILSIIRRRHINDESFTKTLATLIHFITSDHQRPTSTSPANR